MSNYTGIWDIEEPDVDNALHNFKIHSNVIHCMSFDKYTKTNLYTTSYDGTFRSTDLVCLNSEQVRHFFEC